MLLGSVLMLVTIMVVIVFMIAGVLRRSLVNIKALITSGVIGFLMIVLGVLPWEIAEVVGIVALAVGGLAFFFFIWLPSYKEGKLKEEVLKAREYISRDYIKSILRFFMRIGTVIGIVLLVDVVGLWVFLFSQGLWGLDSFPELLTLLLLLEGSLIGAGGAFMFVGYGELRVAREGAINPAIARDQLQRWGERRLSQQKWGVAMLVGGILLVLLGLLIDYIFYSLA